MRQERGLALLSSRPSANCEIRYICVSVQCYGKLSLSLMLLPPSEHCHFGPARLALTFCHLLYGRDKRTGLEDA